MQEYGRANIIPMLLELDEIERFHPLQLWINYMNEVPRIPFYEINKETNQIQEISLYSFEEILSVKMAESDISYRKYELASAKYPVLRVNHITKWF